MFKIDWHPPSGNPLMYLVEGGGDGKVITFLTVLRCLRPQKGGGRKAVKTRLYEVKS
jgi:hypothetical protein